MSFFDKIKKTFSEAGNSVSQRFTDTSHMNWEERIKYYESLVSVEGYVEVLRLMDFHNPDPEKLIGEWGQILEKHPELAFEIFSGLIITNNQIVWTQIHDIHVKALDCVAAEQKRGLKEVIACIEYRKLHDLCARDKLAMIYDYEPNKYEYDPDKMALAEKGDWEGLEAGLKKTISGCIAEQSALSLKLGHALANYAESVGDFERVAGFLKSYISRTENGNSLKWRLAILLRDQQKWDEYIGALKELGKCVDKLEDRIDICQEMIRIYRDIFNDVSRMEKIYHFILSIDPVNEEANSYFIAYYEQNQLWDELLSALEKYAVAVMENPKKSDLYFRIASVYEEHKNSFNKSLQYYEKALACHDANQPVIDKLKQIYKKQENWEKLVSLLKTESNIKDKSPVERAGICRELAVVYRCKLMDENKTEFYYKQVLDIVPNQAEAFQYLANKYKLKQNWYALISILDNKAQLDGDDEKYDSYATIANLYLKEIHLPDKAAEYFEKCLLIKVNDIEIINCLKQHYTEKSDWQKLFVLYRKELGLCNADQERISLLRQMADIASSKMNNDVVAFETWTEIQKLDSQNEDVLSAIAGIKQKCLNDQAWNSLIAIYEIEVKSLVENNEKIHLLKQMADIAQNKLRNRSLAIRFWNQILGYNPNDVDAISALGRFSSSSESQNDAECSETEDDTTPENCNTQRSNAMLNGLKYISGVHGYQERLKSIANKEEADKIKAEIESELNTKRDQLNGCLELFGQYRLEALHDTVGHFLQCLERLKKQFKESDYEFLKEVDIKENDISEFDQIDMQTSEALKTLSVGAGFAAIGLVGTPMLVTAGVSAIGCASTGTAISTLSGAAAHSAVLAWLGGGSIAAGGGGMAAGAVVLTGITATATASVAMVAMGSLASAFYSKKNTESEQYLAEVCIWAAKSRQSMVAIDAIKKRVSEVLGLTHKLELRAVVALEKLDTLIDSFDKTNDEHVQIFQQAALLVKSMSELAKTPILDEEGNINEVANIIVTQTETILNTELL